MISFAPFVNCNNLFFFLFILVFYNKYVVIFNNIFVILYILLHTQNVYFVKKHTTLFKEK